MFDTDICRIVGKGIKNCLFVEYDGDIVIVVVIPDGDSLFVPVSTEVAAEYRRQQVVRHARWDRRRVRWDALENRRPGYFATRLKPIPSL